MPQCPKCGSEITDEMTFCPKCGASLKTAQSQEWREQLRESRKEWRERRREMRDTHRTEKEEEWEKTEKHGIIFVGPLLGGVIVLVIGLFLYFVVTTGFNLALLGALFFVFIGIVIIVGATYGAIIFGRRHPRPPPQPPTQPVQ